MNDTQDPARLDGWNLRWLEEQKMTDTERLAALLRDIYKDEWINDHKQARMEADRIAARLVAAGVRVEDVGQEIHDVTCPDCAAPRIDPDRLARALARRTDRTDAWVLLPKEMQDLWRKDAAAIVKAYEEDER